GGFPPEMLDVVLHHHELLDGTGYPNALRGNQISDIVRVTTIVDIYAALIEKRPYRMPYTHARAFGVMERMGGKLDQQLLQAGRVCLCRRSEVSSIPKARAPGPARAGRTVSAPAFSLLGCASPWRTPPHAGPPFGYNSAGQSRLPRRHRGPSRRSGRLCRPP